MSDNMTYFAKKQAAEQGILVYDQIMEETKRPGEIQKEILLKIIENNKDTEYGVKYHFEDIKSIEDYQKQVPVITYDQIEDDLERMLAGEKNILIAYEFDHMNLTAGTTGKSKMIPLTKEQQNVFARYNYLFNNGLYAKFIDNKYMEGRDFTPIGGHYTKAPSGITLGCASTKAAEYIGGMEAMDNQMRILYTSPADVMDAPDETDTKYIHMRFALMDENMTGIVIGFFSYLVQLLHYVELNYEVLINDIETGTISSEIKIDDGLRERLLKKIVPMPERAARLRDIFKAGGNIQFAPLVWPKLMFIYGVGGAGFSIYDKVIKEKYTGDKIPRVYSGITSSEGLWSISRGINNTDGILAPGSAFMEFLPVEADGDFSQIKTMDQLEVGKIYELIITNYCGFYRYRMSDAVKVTRFENATPCVEYMYRVNKTINIGGEKTTETAINLAVENLSKEMNLDIVDFNVYPDKTKMPGQYQFLLEFSPVAPKVDLEALEGKLYEHLCAANERIKYNVEHGNIAMPKIYRLQPETNLLYRDIQIYKGKPAAQIKPVRVIGDEQQKKFFYIAIEE